MATHNTKKNQDDCVVLIRPNICCASTNLRSPLTARVFVQELSFCELWLVRIEEESHFHNRVQQVQASEENNHGSGITPSVRLKDSDGHGRPEKQHITQAPTEHEALGHPSEAAAVVILRSRRKHT